MPITLTTAKDPGDLDAGTWAQVQVQDMRIDSQQEVVVLKCYYGNVVAGNWVPGEKHRGVNPVEHIISGADYTALMALTPCIRTGDDPIPTEVYDELIAKAVFAGTVS